MTTDLRDHETADSEQARQYLGRVFHDIAAPLTVIKGYLDLLEGELNEVADIAVTDESPRDQISDVLAPINRNTDTLVDLIQNLQLCSRLDRERVTPRLSEFDLVQCCEAVISEANRRFDAEGRISFHASDPVIIESDRDMVARMVKEMIGHAIWYTCPDGAVEVHVHGDNDQVSVVVSEGSSGMLDEDLTNLLNPFYQPAGPVPALGVRRGLGLALLDKVLDHLPGRVCVDRYNPSGTSVRLDLQRGALPMPQDQPPLRLPMTAVASPPAPPAASTLSEFDLISVAAHEFRSPLSNVIGYIEILEEAITGDMDLELMQSVGGALRRSTESLMSVATDFLDLGWISRLPDIGQAGLIDLGGIVRQLAAEMNDAARLAGSTLQVDIAPHPMPLPGDQVAIRAMAKNVIDNAIKFSAPNGLVHVTCRPLTDDHVFEVVDNGIGIDADDLERIRQPFFRASTALEARISGSGLGASIVAEAVRAHRGTFEIESIRGEGTRVVIRLPRRRPEDSVEAQNRETGMQMTTGPGDGL